MAEPAAQRRRLLAGSVADERRPPRRDPALARWFEPAHVRDPSAARTRIADQVAAGADVVVAPTWQSHRRALVDVGETRRAREWTLAAVALAREGVEVGLERRDREAAHDPEAREADGPPGPPEPPGPGEPPLVAGPLPSLEQETGAGRLLPRDAATERDLRDQAGILSDADVDLLLVEAHPGAPMARVAVEAAVSTGLPVWVAALGPPEGDVSTSGPGGPRWAPLIERWAEEGIAAGADLLLAGDATRGSGPHGITEVASALAAATNGRWGGLVAEGAEEADAWLDHGARLLGRLERAAAGSLAPLRAAIDRIEAAHRRLQAARQGRWSQLVVAAARMAPGGPALWLAHEVPTSTPSGFDWLVLPPDAARGLPTGRFGLVVDGSDDADDPPGLGTLAGLLSEGGVLVRPLRDGPRSVGQLRLVRLDEAEEPSLAIHRRED